MAQIVEDYCSYEVAKLLKEKGFPFDELEGGCMELLDLRVSDIYFTCTTALAMKWLREKHDLHIVVYPWKCSTPEKEYQKYCCVVYDTFNLLGHEVYKNETLYSYEEAVEAALKYALVNLI